MTRMVKCYGDDCVKSQTKHPKEIMKVIAGKNYCPDCYAKEMKEREEREKVYSLIKDVYGTPFATPLMKKHVKQFRESGISYKKIYALIHYCKYEKKNFNMPDEKYGIMILGNYLNEMLQYYASKKKQRMKNEGKINKQRTIQIDSKQFLTNKFKDDKIINMEEL